MRDDEAHTSGEDDERPTPTGMGPIRPPSRSRSRATYGRPAPEGERKGVAEEVLEDEAEDSTPETRSVPLAAAGLLVRMAALIGALVLIIQKIRGDVSDLGPVVAVAVGIGLGAFFQQLSHARARTVRGTVVALGAGIVLGGIFAVVLALIVR